MTVCSLCTLESPVCNLTTLAVAYLFLSFFFRCAIFHVAGLVLVGPPVHEVVETSEPSPPVECLGLQESALRLLINCLFRSLKQFLWSALLLLLAIYVVAIYICQAGDLLGLKLSTVVSRT